MIKTKPEEFKKYHTKLMEHAPAGYVPWYFPVIENNKAPDHLAIGAMALPCEKNKYSWKGEHARLSFERAMERLANGKNVGIAARENDPLVIIDIDDYNYKRFLPDTLTDTSRKRVGWHAFCWARDKSVKINIPTDFGEVRSRDQYVVAAGSHCTTLPEKIDDEPVPDKLKKEIKEDTLLGVYSCDKPVDMIAIGFEDLPDFFKQAKNKADTLEKEKAQLKTQTIKPTGKHSALFDLTISNIIGTAPGKREPHPLHSSDTGMNFSISEGISHCWRHLVSLNPIQFLCVKTGYMSCQDAGTGHANGGAGPSAITGDDGAIFYAWLEAKKSNLIPATDPIPVRAMKFLAVENGLVERSHKGQLPGWVYNRVLNIVQENY